MGKITVIKKKKIPGNLFVVIISLSLYLFTNHFTAGVIIEFQAEITVYCDTCTRETINPENIRFLHFTNGGHTRKSIMAAPMFLRIKRSISKYLSKSKIILLTCIS